MDLPLFGELDIEWLFNFCINEASPLFMLVPSNEDALEIDDQFFFGETGLLVKPIVTKGATSTNIYLPDDEVGFIHLIS